MSGGAPGSLQAQDSAASFEGMHIHDRVTVVGVGLLRPCRAPVGLLPRGIPNYTCQVSYYEILEVDAAASQEEIKAAFRRKAKLLHPDVNSAADATATFRALLRAHEVLSNNLLRQEHDRKLDLPSAQAKDPRFARFHRWRREVIPDLEVALDEWTGQVTAIVDAAEKELWSKDHLYRQLTREQAAADDGCSASSTSEAAAAVIDSMWGVLQDALASIQRQYDKRYEQVQVRPQMSGNPGDTLISSSVLPCWRNLCVAPSTARDGAQSQSCRYSPTWQLNIRRRSFLSLGCHHKLCMLTQHKARLQNVHTGMIFVITPLGLSPAPATFFRCVTQPTQTLSGMTSGWRCRIAG